MDPRARALRFDAQQAGMLVDPFTSRKSFDNYVADPCCARGVERQLGEDHARFIALRNISVHGYARVDHQVIWNIIERGLLLGREVDALMG